jgi:hypothetical protein
VGAIRLADARSCRVFSVGMLGANFAWHEPMQDAKKNEPIDFRSLTQLRDEIRVRLHLAQLDAKEKWQHLETQLVGLEHKVVADGGSVVGATAQLARDLKQSLLDFKERLAS